MNNNVSFYGELEVKLNYDFKGKNLEYKFNVVVNKSCLDNEVNIYKLVVSNANSFDEFIIKFDTYNDRYNVYLADEVYNSETDSFEFKSGSHISSDCDLYSVIVKTCEYVFNNLDVIRA